MKKRQFRFLFAALFLLSFLFFGNKLKELNVTNITNQKLDLESVDEENGIFGEFYKDEIQSIEVSFFGCENSETNCLTKNDKEEIIHLLNLINNKAEEKEPEEYYYGGGTNLCLKYQDDSVEDINFIGGDFIQYQDSYFKIEKEDIDNINTIIKKYL